LLAVTIQDIRPNPQDTTAYYVANLFGQLNGTQVPTLPNPAAQFTAPLWSVWVNGLWFMSLVISLTCAVLATLLQQWSRRYLRVAYPRYSPHKRARIRAFYANGVEKLRLQRVVDVLPALLHISLFLFFAGLSVFLFHVRTSIFIGVISWVGLCAILYAFLTILPILHKDSPYSSPLSTTVSFCLTGIRSSFFHFIERFPGVIHRFPFPLQLRNRDARTVHLAGFFSHSMRTTAEHFALKMGPEIDYDSLMWMFQSIDEDKDFEQFFEGIPGLCSSTAVANALNFIKRNEKMFSSALIELMNRTLLSNIIPETVKLRRIIICTKTVDATSLLGPWWILRRVLIGDWYKFLKCIEFGLFVKNWRNITHPVTSFYAECVAAVTISSVPVQEGDDRWFQLASGPLGTSKNLYQNYVKNKDSILLANTISILRRTVQTYSGSAERHRSDILEASSKTLESLRNLNHNRAFPNLQHEFCGVWNQLVDRAQNDDRDYVVCVAKAALKNIRKVYIGLHKGTDAAPMAFSYATDDSDDILDDPRTYCKCNLDDHRPLPPFPDLQIMEPAPDPPPTPVAPVIVPTSPMGVVGPPTSFPTPSPLSRTSAMVPLLSQPTNLNTSHTQPQGTSVLVGSTSPTMGPTSPIPQSAPTLPVPQLSPSLSVPQVPHSLLSAGSSNGGAPSASATSLAQSSSLGHVSTNP
jgi:hypothetical protein